MLVTKKRNANSTVNENDSPKKQKIEKSNKATKVLTKKPAITKKINKNGPKGKPEIKKTEPTDWNKLKKEKKELKLKRKQAKDVYEISIEAKKVYEQLKCHKTSNKAELVEKLYKLISSGDTLRKLILAHDTARIIQCMLKYASPEIHTKLAEQLMPHVVEMCMSKYAHFSVLRMFKYGTNEIKSKLVDSMLGSIIKLVSHNLANKIVDHVYLSVARPPQQAFMRQEFYGELYRRNKDKNVRELSDAYANTPNMKSAILSAAKSYLDKLANKNLVDNSLVHAVMWEYVRACDEEKMEETATAFAPLTPHMLTTREGCHAAIQCFYKSSTKNRRAIIKAVKEHLIKISTHEQGHVFIIALINALDDTKATKKAIFDVLQPELCNLMANTWGRRVIEWFIVPGDTNCFHPTFISHMDEGLKYGKKDKEQRRKEIFEAVQEPIANAILDNAEFLLSNRHVALETVNILKILNDEHFKKISNALAKIVTNIDWKVSVVPENELTKSKVKDIEQIITEATKLKHKKQNLKNGNEENDENDEDEENEEKEDDEMEDDENEDDDNDMEKVVEKTIKQEPGIEEAGMHVVLKKIIKNDKERGDDKYTFGAAIIEHLSEGTLEKWISINRGCFILLNIIENNTEACVEKLKEILLPYKDQLSQQQSSGAQLLLKKII